MEENKRGIRWPESNDDYQQPVTDFEQKFFFFFFSGTSMVN